MSDPVRNFLKSTLHETGLMLFAYWDDASPEEIKADLFAKAEATRNTEIRLPDGYYRVNATAEEMQQLAQEVWDTL